MNRSEKIFLKAFHSVQKELDIIYIMKTIQKLKAGMAALYENDKERNEKMMDTTKAIFYSNMTIYSDSEEEKLM